MREASPLTEPHYQKNGSEVITTNAALRGPDVLDNGGIPAFRTSGIDTFSIDWFCAKCSFQSSVLACASVIFPKYEVEGLRNLYPVPHLWQPVKFG